MAAKKFYVVWKGLKPGVYNTWEECKRQVEGFTGAQYKSFPTLMEANKALVSGFSKSSLVKETTTNRGYTPPILNSISVDAACSGNPGDMEYRGVYTATKEEIFKMGPYPEGTNNIGEFLAIVHGLALLHKNNDPRPVYSDSVNAMGWVRQKVCKTKMKQTKANTPLFDLIARAEKWLHTHSYTNTVLKWETENWGENPADFGRK